MVREEQGRELYLNLSEDHMEQIIWFGHWLWFQWFVRRDGAWLLRCRWSKTRSLTYCYGLDLADVERRSPSGFYLDIERANTFWLLRQHAGGPTYRRDFLGYGEPTVRFRRLIIALSR